MREQTMGTRFAVLVLTSVLGSVPVLRADEKAAAKELVNYIVDARRQGVADPAIRKNAVAAGWPAESVDDAIANGTKPQPADGPEHPAVLPPAATSPLPPAPKAGGRPSTAGQDPSKSHGVPDNYVIGAGDVLQINVWKEPDASVGSVVVRPDGMISMPLLKEIEAAGMTPRQLEHLITERITRFIDAPDVTIMVTTINSKKIYIVGAAKREGPLAYTYRMTIMQAISEAGGLSDYAKPKKIYVLRTDNGKEYQMPFNYEEVIKGEKMEQNIPLLPGDVLVIPH